MGVSVGVGVMHPCAQGVPMLEAKYDTKFADSLEYQHYKTHTSVLIPWCPAPAFSQGEAVSVSMMENMTTKSDAL
jgi:hypothetical protein